MTMFTGIIRHVGRIESVETVRAGRRVAISLGPLAVGLKLGDSVAVNGVCLTVAVLRGEVGQFDVIHETLARTTLGGLASGGRVNLEPALRLGDGLDGHLVQGHVDGLARVAGIREGATHELDFSAAPPLTGGMVARGSIAIDGVSLTLTHVHRDNFGVAIIPTTLRETTLGQLRIGDKTNIETDLIGKYVMKCLQTAPRSNPDGGGQTSNDGLTSTGGLTMEKLQENGFL